MHQKRGQLSIFLIAVVLLLMIIALIYFATLPFLQTDDELVFDRQVISQFIQSCVTTTAEDGILLLGRQGGIFNPEQAIQTPYHFIALHYQDHQSIAPSQAQVEQELATYVDENLLTCLNNLDAFKELGWVVNHNQPSATAQFNDQDTSINVQFFLQVQQNSISFTFDEFQETLPIRMKKILELDHYINDFAQQRGPYFDFTDLAEYDIDITIIPYEQHLIISLTDLQSTIQTQPYSYQFGMSTQ